MKLLSLNVGQPRSIQLVDRTILTSIWKTPVQGRRGVHKHNIDGDRQSDLTVHGGPYKAVYAYASEHYPRWADELPGAELPPGAFGENLTLEGLTEEEACIGDTYRIGSALLKVTQPRMPCYKLNLRFGRADMVKRFWRSGLSGIYFSIAEEGNIGEGDTIELVATLPDAIRVADVVRLFKRESADPDLYKRAMSAPLWGSWKRDIHERWNEEQMALL